MSVTLILLIIALVLLLGAAIGWPKETPVSLGWLGLFFYVLAALVGKG